MSNDYPDLLYVNDFISEFIRLPLIQRYKCQQFDKIKIFFLHRGSS